MSDTSNAIGPASGRGRPRQDRPARNAPNASSPAGGAAQGRQQAFAVLDSGTQGIIMIARQRAIAEIAAEMTIDTVFAVVDPQDVSLLRLKQSHQKMVLGRVEPMTDVETTEEFFDRKSRGDEMRQTATRIFRFAARRVQSVPQYVENMYACIAFALLRGVDSKEIAGYAEHTKQTPGEAFSDLQSMMEHGAERTLYALSGVKNAINGTGNPQSRIATIREQIRSKTAAKTIDTVEWNGEDD